MSGDVEARRAAVLEVIEKELAEVARAMSGRPRESWNETGPDGRAMRAFLEARKDGLEELKKAATSMPELNLVRIAAEVRLLDEQSTALACRSYTLRRLREQLERLQSAGELQCVPGEPFPIVPSYSENEARGAQALGMAEDVSEELGLKLETDP